MNLAMHYHTSALLRICTLSVLKHCTTIARTAAAGAMMQQHALLPQQQQQQQQQQQFGVPRWARPAAACCLVLLLGLTFGS
jgi:hypothetical protein